MWLALADGHWAPIHLTVIWTLTLLTAGLWSARKHRVRAHRTRMMLLFFGPILLAGALTFLPGRLMWRLFFG